MFQFVRNRDDRGIHKAILYYLSHEVLGVSINAGARKGVSIWQLQINFPGGNIPACSLV